MDTKEVLEGINSLGTKVDDYRSELSKVKINNLELAEELRQIKSKAGKLNTPSGYSQPRQLKDVIADGFNEHFNQIKEIKESGERLFQTKDFLLSTGLTGAAFNSNIPTPPLFPTWTFHLSQLIATIGVPTGQVNVPVQTYPSNTGSFGKNTEGGTKANININVTNKLVALKYVAAYTRVSREASLDLPYLTGLLADELAELFQQTLDSIIVTNILAGATSGSSGASVPAEKLIDNVLQLVTAGHSPNAIISSPASWATLIRTKPTDYGLPGGYEYDNQGNLMFAGLPVLISNAIASGHVVIGDFNRGVKLFQAESFNLVRSEFSTNPSTGVSDFIQNMITWRAEARIEPIVLSTDSFVYASI